MKIAAIDLGTNSFLCLIAEVTAGVDGSKKLTKIFDVCRVIRLGEKVHANRAFLPAALKRAATCLDEFEQIVKKYKVDKVIATATSAARDVKNGDELMKLGKDRKIPISIIGGSKEAELSFAGAVSGVNGAQQKKILVVDVGGGSTEFIFREPKKKMNAQSFDVGCVRLTEMFLKKDPIDHDEYDQLSAHAAKTIAPYAQVMSESKPDLIIGVAGTPTTLACIAQNIDFDEYKVEGYQLTRREISGLAKKLGDIPLAQRKNLKGLEPLMADVIIAGCALLEQALELVQRESMTVSTRGLRYGVALNHEEFK